jgi:hypothetical protein
MVVKIVLKIGDSWVHLCLCLICGHVGCCDSSNNKHATKHFHSTEHPIFQLLNLMSIGSGVIWMKHLSKLIEGQFVLNKTLQTAKLKQHK